jgi:hypothetical protein
MVPVSGQAGIIGEVQEGDISAKGGMQIMVTSRLTRLPCLVLAAMVLTACAAMPVAMTPPARGNEAKTGPVEEHQLVACIDRSTSYRLTAAAIAALADLLPQIQQTGVAWTVHLRWIEENSYRPEAHIRTIRIEPLPPEPVPPAPSANPLMRRRHLQAMAAYEKERQQWQETVDRLKEEAKQQAEAVRATTWSPAYGSDIWGCIQKAGELLGGRGGWVVIASDMEVYGRQQRATVELKGARVHIIFWQSDDAQEGERLRRQWTALLSEAGAAFVAWHDPSVGLTPLLDEMRRR